MDSDGMKRGSAMNLPAAAAAVAELGQLMVAKATHDENSMVGNCARLLVLGVSAAACIHGPSC
jgi:hypothetical protein